MGCIFAVFTFLFPRLAFLLVWVARPEMVDDAFDSFIVPFFGVFVLPFTTLMYVVLYPPNGIDGTDWIWIGIAAFFDVVNLGGNYVQREQVTSSYNIGPRMN
jgi:hypothetical protein